jgi:hypothetical protein
MTQSSAAYSGMRRVRNPPNGWLVLAGLDVAAVACAQTPKLGIGSTVTPTTGERITTDIAEYGCVLEITITRAGTMSGHAGAGIVGIVLRRRIQ